LPFVLTDKKTQFRAKYKNGIVLTFRAFKREKDDNEADRFEKELAKIRGTRAFDEKFERLMIQVGKKLLTAWEGVVDEEGKQIDFTPENVDRFLENPEAQKYWYRPLSEYLYPPKDTDESELPEGEDPNF